MSDLVGWEEQRDGGARVSSHLRADLVRVELVHQKVVDVLRHRVGAVWKRFTMFAAQRLNIQLATAIQRVDSCCLVSYLAWGGTDFIAYSDTCYSNTV